MRVLKKKKPRSFLVSQKNNINLKDVGTVYLNDDEHLTITGNNKKIYEICKKSWGYYATSSINFRQKKNGFKTALVKQDRKFFVLIVDKDKRSNFKSYIKKENYKIIKWLDEKR
tara:strand:- start:334 stop:675 length:342 start_codon:yes stop_codon:yes gene_type:complete